jgi:hypothetical protein
VASHAASVGRRQFYCIGPLQDTCQAALQTDLANLQTAMLGVQATEAFLPAVAGGQKEPTVCPSHLYIVHLTA